MQISAISSPSFASSPPSEKVEGVWQYQLEINYGENYIIFLIPYSLLNIACPGNSFQTDPELANKTPMEQYQIIKNWDKFQGRTVCLIRRNAYGKAEFYSATGSACIQQALKGRDATYIINILQEQLVERLGKSIISTQFEQNRNAQPLTLGTPYKDPYTFVMDSERSIRLNSLRPLERQRWEESQITLNEIIQEFCKTLQKQVPNAPLLPHERVISSLKILSVIAFQQLPKPFQEENPALRELFWVHIDSFQKILEACSVATSTDQCVKAIKDALEELDKISHKIDDAFSRWKKGRELGQLTSYQGSKRSLKKSAKRKRKYQDPLRLRKSSKLFMKIPDFLCRFLRCTLEHSDSHLIDSVKSLDKLLNSTLEQLFPCSINNADANHTLNYLIEALEKKISLVSELLKFYQLEGREPIIEILEEMKASVEAKDWIEVNRLLFKLHNTPFMSEMLTLARSEELFFNPSIIDKNYLFGELLFLMDDFNHVTRNASNFKMIDFNAWQWCQEALEQLVNSPELTDFSPLISWLERTGISFHGGARPLKKIAKEIRKKDWVKRFCGLTQGLSNGNLIGTHYQKFCSEVELIEKEFREALKVLSEDIEDFQNQVFVAIQEIDTSAEMLAKQFQLINERILFYAEPIADFLTNFKQLFFTPIAEKKAGLDHFSLQLLTTNENELRPLPKSCPLAFLEDRQNEESFTDQLRQIFRKGKTRKILDGVIELLDERKLPYEITQGGNHRKLLIDGQLVVIPEHKIWKSGTSHAIYGKIYSFLGKSA